MTLKKENNFSKYKTRQEKEKIYKTALIIICLVYGVTQIFTPIPLLNAIMIMFMVLERAIVLHVRLIQSENK